MDGSSQTVSPRRKRLLTASFLLAIVAFCASSAFGAAPDAADTSLTDFPRLAGETDDAPRLQRAIDATKGGILYLPRGDYDIASTLVISNRCSLLMHRSATLRAVAEMDYVLRVRHQGVWDHLDFLCFIQGGAIDGNGLASCLSLENYWRQSLDEMERPLVFAGPGVKKGYKIPWVTLSPDVGATIAHMLGVPPARAWTGRVIDDIFE